MLFRSETYGFLSRWLASVGSAARRFVAPQGQEQDRIIFTKELLRASLPSARVLFHSHSYDLTTRAGAKPAAPRRAPSPQCRRQCTVVGCATLRCQQERASQHVRKSHPPTHLGPHRAATKARNSGEFFTPAGHTGHAHTHRTHSSTSRNLAKVTKKPSKHS